MLVSGRSPECSDYPLKSMDEFQLRNFFSDFFAKSLPHTQCKIQGDTLSKR